jgi:hypothetical protein
MASEIRVNQIQNRSGLSTVTFSDTGVVISGITTITDLRASGNTIVAAGSTSAPSISPTGDSNTGIFFPSPDTIAFAEGGVEAARFDSGGRLGIGTIPKTWSSGYNVLHVGAASLVGQSEQDGTTSNWSNNAYFDTNDNRWEYSGADQASQITQSDGLIIFKTASTGSANAALSWTESARFNTSGNLAFPSGQGIDFSATSNSSGTMTSELLADYEEGTWTPSWDTAENNWSGTYSDQSGLYTKIGRQVTLGFRLVGTRSAGTGALRISGLPFDASSNDRFVFNVSPTFGGTWGSTNAPCAGFISPTTRILLKKPDGSDSRVQADTNVDAALVGSSFGLIGTITYFTS